MAKRLFDILFSLLVLVAAAPVILTAMVLIWRQDGQSPLFLAARVGKDGRDFRMVKLRSMTVGSELNGATSTAWSDERITPLGHFLRRWKIDELPQFWNVLRGQMSLVGPRPNTRRGGVERYTAQEMRLLSARPGITDLSSILFSDEAEILNGAADPDALYDAVIRPWKSRLGLLYLDHRSFLIDLRIIWLTAVAILAKPPATRGVDAILNQWDASQALRDICRRDTAAPPQAEPPGAIA